MFAKAEQVRYNLGNRFSMLEKNEGRRFVMKKIQVNGVTLAYEELGIGDNVVIASQNRFSPNYRARLLAQPP